MSENLASKRAHYARMERVIKCEVVDAGRGAVLDATGWGDLKGGFDGLGVLLIEVRTVPMTCAETNEWFLGGINAAGVFVYSYTSARTSLSVFIPHSNIVGIANFDEAEPDERS
jgi:hypothetical protein